MCIFWRYISVSFFFCQLAVFCILDFFLFLVYVISNLIYVSSLICFYLLNELHTVPILKEPEFLQLWELFQNSEASNLLFTVQFYFWLFW